MSYDRKYFETSTAMIEHHPTPSPTPELTVITSDYKEKTDNLPSLVSPLLEDSLIKKWFREFRNYCNDFERLQDDYKKLLNLIKHELDQVNSSHAKPVFFIYENTKLNENTLKEIIEACYSNTVTDVQYHHARIQEIMYQAQLNLHTSILPAYEMGAKLTEHMQLMTARVKNAFNRELNSLILQPPQTRFELEMNHQEALFQIITNLIEVTQKIFRDLDKLRQLVQTELLTSKVSTEQNHHIFDVSSSML